MTESGSGSSYGSPSDPGDRSTPDDGSRGGAAGREWVSQLQSMIDNVTTQAAPILRDIAAKAAELAAAAGDKAGPIAHKAADATEAAGAKLAERGRGVAADLRRDPASGGGEGAAAGDVPNAIQPGPGAQSAPANPRPGVVADSADSLGE
jgi:hypothetical protein